MYSNYATDPLGTGTYGMNQDWLSLGNYGNPFITQSQGQPFSYQQPTVPKAPMAFDQQAGSGGGFTDGLFDNFLGKKNADGSVDMGWGGMALGAAQGLGNAYMAMKQYGLAKDSLAESKRQFQLNYDAQKSATNSALEDRQRARVASNAGAYQSVGDYMDKNGIR